MFSRSSTIIVTIQSLIYRLFFLPLINFINGLLLLSFFQHLSVRCSTYFRNLKVINRLYTGLSNNLPIFLGQWLIVNSVVLVRVYATGVIEIRKLRNLSSKFIIIITIVLPWYFLRVALNYQCHPSRIQTFSKEMYKKEMYDEWRLGTLFWHSRVDCKLNVFFGILKKFRREVFLYKPIKQDFVKMGKHIANGSLKPKIRNLRRELWIHLRVFLSLKLKFLHSCIKIHSRKFIEISGEKKKEEIFITTAKAFVNPRITSFRWMWLIIKMRTGNSTLF